MATLSHIAVHPIKALDPASLDRVSITEIGGLSGDRVYGIVDADGDYVHGKRTQDVHKLETEFDLERNRITLQIRGESQRFAFHLDHDRASLEEWLSEYFGIDVELKMRPGGAQTDSVVYADSAAGPTLISSATVREVASWYDGIDSEEMRLRLRPNLVVDGVPPFWEDKLVADGGRHVRIGDVTLSGVMPVPRCVVPTRNPNTGAEYEGFRERFIEKREETLPEWTDRDTLDGNFFSLMAATRIPEADRSGELAVGEELRLVDTIENLI